MEDLRKEPLPADEDGRRVWSTPRVAKADISVVTQHGPNSGPVMDYGGTFGIYTS